MSRQGGAVAMESRVADMVVTALPTAGRRWPRARIINLDTLVTLLGGYALAFTQLHGYAGRHHARIIHHSRRDSDPRALSRARCAPGRSHRHHPSFPSCTEMRYYL